MKIKRWIFTKLICKIRKGLQSRDAMLGQTHLLPSIVLSLLLRGIIVAAVMSGLSSCTQGVDNDQHIIEMESWDYGLNLLELTEILQPGMTSREVIEQFGRHYDRERLDDDIEIYRYFTKDGIVRPIVPNADFQVTGFDIYFTKGKLVEWRPISRSGGYRAGMVRSSAVGKRSLRLFVLDGQLLPEETDIRSMILTESPKIAVTNVIFQRYRDRTGERRVAIEMLEGPAEELAKMTEAHIGKLAILALDEYPVSVFEIEQPLNGTHIIVTENISPVAAQ